MDTEERSFKSSCEVRQDSGSPVLTGYGAVFNRSSADMGFVEQLDPAVFTKTLKENKDIRSYFNHDPNQILGRTSNGSLRLMADNIGLRYEVDLNMNDPAAQSVYAKVQRGDVDGSSFAFNAVRDDWNWMASPPERRVLEARLYEVGPVTVPTYPDAKVTATRALAPIAQTLGRPVDELVEALRTGEIRSMMTPAAEQRAVWSTAMVNNLPDSSFLYIEGGGSKDADGKTTPRTLRHFPYKDASGKVDLPHLRNALARIPQSNLPSSVKDTLTAKAEKILSANGGGRSMNDEAYDEVWASDDQLLEAVAELRAGRTLSKASITHLEGVIQSLRDLLDVAQKDSPMDSDVGDPADTDQDQDVAGRSIEMLAAEMRLRELSLAS